MQPDGVKLLLAEYDRLKALECERLKGYENATQLYLTVISAAGGMAVLLVNNQGTSPGLPVYLCVLASFALCFGVITYLRLLGLDVAIADYAHSRQLIRKWFEDCDGELTNAFPIGINEDPAAFGSWASIRGIVRRCFMVSQQKTMVGGINCVVAGSLAVVVVWPETVMTALTAGGTVAALAAGLQVGFTSWRYRQTYTCPGSRLVRFWS